MSLGSGLNKKAVLLINLGTPDGPGVSKVYRYLTEFLNDPRVIDIPFILRFILVNLIIIPFRVFASSKAYKELWTENGSPLLYYGERVRDALDHRLGEQTDVHLAMRYGKPSLNEVCAKMEKQGYESILILPLFPQYASASTGSAIEKAMRLIRNWYVIPEIRVVSQFFEDEGYIAALKAKVEQYDFSDYDHVLMSYHGLPTRQLDKVYDEGLCNDRDCENEITAENFYCYKAECYATSRALAKELGLERDDYTVSFQSRLDKNWIEPFSDKVIEEFGKKGAKRLLVISPAFVSDCLETIVEIGSEYQELFEKFGGEKIQLVEGLNDSEIWLDALENIISVNSVPSVVKRKRTTEITENTETSL